MLRQIIENKAMLVGCILILIFTATAIFSAWLSPFDPFAQNIRFRLKPPGETYWLGTDGYGRDILSRISGAPAFLLPLEWLQYQLAQL